MEFELTPEFLGAVVGAVLTVLFTYFPVLRTKFGELKTEQKSGIMLALLLVASVVIYLGQCVWPMWQAGLVCGQAGIWQVISIFVAAVMGNTATYVIAPQPSDVVEVKASR